MNNRVRPAPSFLLKRRRPLVGVEVQIYDLDDERHAHVSPSGKDWLRCVFPAGGIHSAPAPGGVFMRSWLGGGLRAAIGDHE